MKHFVIAALITLLPTVASAQRLMENLGRGVVAIRQDENKVFIAWRMLGTDADDVAFNVYRGTPTAEPVKLNDRPLGDVTFFVDTGARPGAEYSYFVRPIANGKEQDASRPFALRPAAPPQPYLSIPLETPAGYGPNDASVGDLDGDGEYEIVLHQVGRSKDNSQNGVTDPPILQAYTLAGKKLWEINLGRNIRDGAHYTQFMVYDLDCDGRAEVVCKTADGTVDGTGKVIGEANANYVNDAGRILKGPEFLTVFDGLSGKELSTIDYIPPRGENLKQLWGDDYGNRCDRFLACVAYLDGARPSVVMCRGYYTRTVLAAFDFRDGKLAHRWTFDSDAPGNKPYASQGNHNISVADVDDDGRDEIVYGGMCIDETGKGLWTTGLGHGDAMHVSDLDPTHPGLEMFRIQERFDEAGAHMVDLRTGKVLWRKPSLKSAKSGGDKGEGPGRGVAFDVDPRFPGMESWTAGAGIEGMWDAKSNEISRTKPGSMNFAVWWDGDLLRELLDKNHISKWNYEKQTTDRVLTADGCTSNNGTKATPTLSADLFGDWREEVIWPTTDGEELRVFVSTIPTDRRLYTFMHDPQYRLAIAWQNVAYNQPPHTSFYVGPDMKTPPRPKIKLVERSASASNAAAENAVTPAPSNARTWMRKLPEGNYRVTLTLGDPSRASDTCVKAESRRIMLERVRTRPGEIVKRSFLVNVRTPKLANGGDVRLNAREKASPTWDDELTIEFLGDAPAVRDVEVAPALADAITVYLAGDSTVTDQTGEPWAGWGQILPRFFNPTVAVANHAESGRSLRSFRAERRLDKILATIEPGDYLFIQFGHNDMKEKGDGVGAFTSYKSDLKQYIGAARERGGTPVIVTSMHRRRFDDSGKIVNTFGDYIEAARQAAAEEKAPLIDLNAMSAKLYESWGVANSKKAFVHYPANTFPDQDKPLKDDTHFNAYGAYELARCVVEGIRAAKLPLAGQLADDVKPFDPAKPDPIEAVVIPASPVRPTVTPEGR